MKRHLYPSNWNTIALIIKNMANWRCEECDRPCRRPGENWYRFAFHLFKFESHWYPESFDSVFDREAGKFVDVEKPGRFVLTVAHLDQDPGNNSRENLKALCPTCHNRHDAPHRAKNAAKTRFANKHKGQLDLF